MYGEDDTTTPLIEATLRGFSEVVEALLLHGASPSHTDVINNTALHWAIAACHWNCLMLLLECGSPLETANYRLRTPLMQAAFYGRDEIAQCLIDRGAKVDQPLNSNKESALTIASEMVRELSSSCDVNHLVPIYQTAFYFTAELVTPTFRFASI